MEIYCRFTVIDSTTYSFLSLKCVYIFLADPVYIAHVKNKHSYTSTPLHIFTACWLIKHNDLVFTIPITVNMEVKKVT